MNRNGSRSLHPGAAIGIAWLLVIPPFLGGGGSSAGLLGIQTAILLLLILPPGLAVPRRPPLPWILFAAATGWSVLSFLGVEYRFGSFVSLLDLVFVFLLMTALLRRQATAADRLAVQRLVIGAAALQAIAALAGVAASPAVRAAGFFDNPNHLAAYLGIGFWAAGERVVRAPLRSERAAAAVCCLLLAAALLPTGSRGALGSLLAVLGVLVLVSVRRLGRLRAAAAILAVVLLAAAGASAVISRFRAVDDPYRHARVRIWAAAWRVALDHPLLGVGPGMLESRSANYNPPEPGGPIRFSKRFLSAHSSYLQVAAETGFPGLLLAVAAAGATLAGLRRRDPDRPVAWTAPALASLLLHGLVENLLGVPALVLAIAIPVATGWPAGPRPGGEGDGEEPGRPGGRRFLPGGTVLLVATYVWLALVWRPYLADRRFRSMRMATDPAAFTGALVGALRSNPYQPYYYWEAARRALGSVGRIDTGLYALCHGYLGTAIRLEPGEARFHRDLARLEVRAFGDLFRDAPTSDRALAAFDRAFDLNRTDPRPLVERARFQRRIGRPEDGLEGLDRALEVEPAYLGARLERLEVLRELGWEAEWRAGAGEFEEWLHRLEEYRPRNDYERSLLAFDRQRWDRLRALLPPPPKSLP